jgi:asparagine synthase (glutamine-hydrolysing)
MCGIAGFVGLADRDVIMAMTDIQAHRGPDDAETVVLDDHSVALGHRRLSIIDLQLIGFVDVVEADKIKQSAYLPFCLP